MIYKQHLALEGLAHMTIRTKLMPCNLEAEIHLELEFNDEENTKNLDSPSYGSPRETSEAPAPEAEPLFGELAHLTPVLEADGALHPIPD